VTCAENLRYTSDSGLIMRFAVLRRDDNINRGKCNFLHDAAHIKRTAGQTLRGKHCESIASPTSSIIFHALARCCHHHCILARNAPIQRERERERERESHIHTHTHIYYMYMNFGNSTAGTSEAVGNRFWFCISM